jgi:hypothetical protein
MVGKIGFGGCVSSRWSCFAHVAHLFMVLAAFLRSLLQHRLAPRFKDKKLKLDIKMALKSNGERPTWLMETTAFMVGKIGFGFVFSAAP